MEGPKEKKLKFYNKGKELYEKGDYVKAKLEIKNAIQIDPKYARCLLHHGINFPAESGLPGRLMKFPEGCGTWRLKNGMPKHN